MDSEEEKLRKEINSKAHEILNLLSEVNEIDKTVSRLKNELNDMYAKLNGKLDKEINDESAGTHKSKRI